MSFEISRPGQDRLRAWGLLIPAIVWTLAFFVLPLVIMAVYSLWKRVGTKLVTEASLSNYEAFFSKSFLFQSLINSLEVTVLVTIISIVH